MELEAKKIDVGKYEISILEERESVTLILKAADQPENNRGNTSNIPGFEVEIRKSDLHVIRSNYIR